MIPGFDIRAAYQGLSRRFTQLAREPGSGIRQPGKGSGRTASAALSQTRDLEEEAILATREQLSKAFKFAHERGQVDMALSLLQQEVPAKKLEAILAAMPPRSRRGNLYERMAEVPPPDIGLGPPQEVRDAQIAAATVAEISAAAGRPNATAAAINAAYDLAVGRSPIRHHPPGNPR